MKRSPIQRGKPLARGGPLKRHKPMPRRSTKPGAAARRAEKFGPQAALCRTTMCVIEFALHWRKLHGEREPIDWTKLPDLGPGARRSDPHHEPFLSHGGKDEDTVPMSQVHHTHGFHPRHGGVGRGYSRDQWWMERHRIDYTEPRDEMRRRVEASRGTRSGDGRETP